MLKTGGSRARAFQLYTTSIHLIGLFIIIVASISLTDGKLVYTLDDPYIHLSLSQSITVGEYGINPGEFASPSSSILYPLLLSLGLISGIEGESLPLLLTVPFSIAATWLLAGFVWRALDQESGLLIVFVALLIGPAIVLATNALALPMTGMEQSIHVFATILALTGLYTLSIDPARRGAVAAVIAGILLCATIRFEGLALVVGALAALYALGLRRQAIMTGLAVLLVLGSYAVIMDGIGLPVFPSSVMTKSDIAAQAGDGNAFGIFTGFVQNAWDSLNSRWGLLLAIASVILVSAALSKRPEIVQLRIFLVTVAFVLCAHVFAGKYGWFGRYEVYAVGAMLLGLFALARAFPKTAPTLLAAPLLLLVVGAPYASITLKTPAASANIYQQHYQLHRFVTDFFPERVAVNDLGYISYGNDNYVLDLWGLGSEEARRFSSNNQWTPDLLQQITRRHDIAYAMIYTAWFKQVPADWCHVANLVTSKVSTSRDTVAFYLLQPDRKEEMRVALRAFSTQLPSGARLDILNCETDG